MKLNRYCVRALPSVLKLLSALRTGDIHGAGAVSASLAGLGVGLTPSADDLLSGIMLSVTLGARNGLRLRASRTMTAAICSGAYERTSALSLEYMRQAEAGRANEKVARMVEELYTGSELGVRDSVSQVVQIGETSGTDTAVGIILGSGVVCAEGGR